MREFLGREDGHVRAHVDRCAERDAHRAAERALVVELRLHVLLEALFARLLRIAILWHHLQRQAEETLVEAPRHDRRAVHKKVHEKLTRHAHLYNAYNFACHFSVFTV